MRIKVDLDLCQGHSVCMEECPEVFSVQDQAGSYPHVVVLMEEPPEALRDKVLNAVRGCPNRVISIVED